MARQLAFDLPVRVSRSRGDFFVSDANARAVARLEDTGGWPNGKLVLVGPEGSGKTHLGHVWAEAENALFLPSISAQSSLPDAPVVLEIGDFTPESEEALFHLHNLASGHQRQSRFCCSTGTGEPARVAADPAAGSEKPDRRHDRHR